MPELEKLLRQVLKDKGLDPDMASLVLQPEAALPGELATASRAVLERLTAEAEQLPDAPKDGEAPAADPKAENAPAKDASAKDAPAKDEEPSGS